MTNVDEAVGIGPMTTHFLETKYQESLQTVEGIKKDEELRRLRLQIFFLEDENSLLHDQLAAQDENVGVLEEERLAMEKHLEQYEGQLHRQDMELLSQLRELKNLKAELSSMGAVSSDSTKLLTEKLALSRELANLKPELEHLRTQAASQQILFAEKLTLQRQLSTLEVELETVKSNSRRVAPQMITNNREGELLREAEELRKELARERREKERVLKQHEKESNEWVTNKTALESKLEATKSKLRDVRTHIKSLRIDLAQAQAMIGKTIPTIKNDATPPNPRKRAASEMATDATIGTPDGVAARGRRAASKRGFPEHTILGEKSTFSITPYLNRTLSSAADKDQSSPGGGNPQVNQCSPGTTNGQEDELIPLGRAATQHPHDALGMEPNVDQTASLSKASVLAESKLENLNRKRPAKKSHKLGFLEKVTEENFDENEETRAKSVTKLSTAPKGSIPTNVQEFQEMKKKKRKLLGSAKTIFDEEDAENARRPGKVILAPSKSNITGIGRGGMGGVEQVGGFSPLKKDRRGTHASFLV